MAARIPPRYFDTNSARDNYEKNSVATLAKSLLIFPDDDNCTAVFRDSALRVSTRNAIIERRVIDYTVINNNRVEGEESADDYLLFFVAFTLRSLRKRYHMGNLAELCKNFYDTERGGGGKKVQRL